MPRGDKSSYTDKQKRQAEHTEEGDDERGVNKKEAKKAAATRKRNATATSGARKAARRK